VSLGLNGVASNNSWAQSNTADVTITSTGTILVLALHFELNGSAPVVTSLTDTEGLTWTRRSFLSSFSIGIGAFNRTEVWWAHAPSGVVADTITVITDIDVDAGTISAFGLTGFAGDPSAPFDDNVSLPKKVQNTGESAIAASAVISTHHDDGLIVGVWTSCEGSIANADTPHGFSQLFKLDNENDDGDNFSEMSVQSKFISAKQTNLTVSFLGALPHWDMIVDVISNVPLIGANYVDESELDAVATVKAVSKYTDDSTLAVRAVRPNVVQSTLIVTGHS
jgi:hypothetical protein